MELEELKALNIINLVKEHTTGNIYKEYELLESGNIKLSSELMKTYNNIKRNLLVSNVVELGVNND